MLTIVVVDRQAEQRTHLVEELSFLLGSEVAESELIPRVTILPLSRQELKFHAAPDICVIGPGLVEEEFADVAAIRALLPTTILLARVGSQSGSLQRIQQLAGMGVDDVLPVGISATELCKKLILLSRRAQARQLHQGRMIVVDSGKGGVGVTTMVAALADSLSRSGKRVVILDCDFETQDLSRFLHARPYLNENLQQLFDHARPVTKEFVEQCLVPVWGSESGVSCIPPIGESDALYDTQSTHPRTLLSVLEVLDATVDYVIVDVGCARGGILRTLYRAADEVLFLVSNDPATLFASVDRIRVLRSQLSPQAKLAIVANGVSAEGLAPAVLLRELTRAGIAQEQIISAMIPWCEKGMRWPGSGESLLGLGSKKVQQALDQVSQHIRQELLTPEQQLSETPGGRGVAGALAELLSVIAARLAPPSAQPHLPKSSETPLLPRHPTPLALPNRGDADARLPLHAEPRFFVSPAAPSSSSSEERGARGPLQFRFSDS